METSFPAPTPYDGNEDVRGPPGTAYQAVNNLVVQRAFRGTSCKKSPGPGGIGPPLPSAASMTGSWTGLWGSLEHITDSVSIPDSGRLSGE